MGSYLPYVRLEGLNIVIGVALAAVLGVMGSLLPAWRASRLRVVDAIRRVA
jgi:ABC-type antimicrobial peptide transport system permease subunit